MMLFQRSFPIKILKEYSLIYYRPPQTPLKGRPSFDHKEIKKKSVNSWNYKSLSSWLRYFNLFYKTKVLCLRCPYICIVITK